MNLVNKNTKQRWEQWAKNIDIYMKERTGEQSDREKEKQCFCFNINVKYQNQICPSPRFSKKTRVSGASRPTENFANQCPAGPPTVCSANRTNSLRRNNLFVNRRTLSSFLLFLCPLVKDL